MKYVCLCYDEDAKLKAMPKTELDALMKEAYARSDELRQKGQLTVVQALQSVETATTCGCATASCPPPTARLPRPRSNWTGSS
jgi:hypothetical protein